MGKTPIILDRGNWPVCHPCIFLGINALKCQLQSPYIYPTFIAQNQFPHTVVDLKTYLCTDIQLKEGRGAGRKNARKISYFILYGIPSINQPSFRQPTYLWKCQPYFLQTLAQTL